MMAAAPLVRVTSDHLALIRALIQAGQTGRAMELLDTVWHGSSPEEQCWYLRIWLLTAEGRVVEALDVARLAARELPGSAAVAYLQAVLEQVHGDPQAALAAGERAARLAPDQPLATELAALLVADNEPFDAPGRMIASLPGHPDPTTSMLPNPMLAAQLGAALLHPLGSTRPLLPAPVKPVRASVAKPTPTTNRKLGLIAIGTVLAALWGIRDPIPAFFALAGIVVLTIRNPRS